MNSARFCLSKAIFAAILLCASVIFCFSCSHKEKETAVEQEPDLTITQTDIMLLAEHKKTIDAITAKYDKKIAEVPPSAAYKLIEEGKGEINGYLESKGLKPEVFMKKSKKILKCYLALNEISDETMQKRIELLKQNDTSEKDIKIKTEAYKKAGEAFFQEMTAGLTKKEIDLVRSNLSIIASVTD
ncbi:hypothetical protein IKO70_08695 [bacterium]|jgi:uncharacterized membrane protein|nr:hypothetical protein [bacterium]